jgi:Tfp pilus assembly protein PilP
MNKSTEFEKAYSKLPAKLQRAVNMFDNMLAGCITTEALHQYVNQTRACPDPQVKPLLAEIAQNELDNRAKHGR